MKRLVFVALFFIAILSVFAVPTHADMERLTNEWKAINPFTLPQWMMPEEEYRMQDYRSELVITPPPTAPVRQVAEFERATSVMIVYPLGIPYSFVAQLSEEIMVTTVVENQTIKNEAISSFQSHGVNMDNIRFLIAPTDSYWSRDFGPWFIFDGNDNLCVLDFVYNRPRPLDDQVPVLYATYDTLTTYGMNLKQTGGNYMCDGLGIAASTQIAYTENANYTNAQVDQIMTNYCGIQDYNVIQDPNNTYIDHIDCWGKFLSPDKVLIRSVPTSHAQYDEIEAVATYFSTLMSSYGHPFHVYRVYTPNDQPYTNSLILNNRVFVPQVNGSYDDDALATYQTAMPGYQIIGVPQLSTDPWISTDALHCRTHELADRRMLYIYHMPLADNQPANIPLTVNAYIKAHSNQSLYADSLLVFYKTNSNPSYQSVTFTDQGNNNYVANIPGQPEGTIVSYYIHAADMSGRSENHPFIGAPDPHQFTIVADTTPPTITHTPLQNISLSYLPVLFSAMVSDDGSIDTVYVEYKINNGNVAVLPLMETDTSFWQAPYDGNGLTMSDSFAYRIVAKDASNNIGYFPCR